jgi:L-threonylcarbamoyladenylate synthase
VKPAARVLHVEPTAPDAGVIAEAAAVLRDGGLVAFPTETVYGLGAHALDPAAVARIFEAKGRPSYNPLIVHVPDADAARAVVAAWPDIAARAAAEFWPGPLTLVLPRADGVPDAVTAGLDTVGVRVPAHPVALALLRAAAVPVAAPSANRFTRVSPTTAGHVAAGLGHRADLILDGGATPVGIESSVLDLSRATPVLLRPGAVGIHELVAVLGAITVAASAGGAAAGEEARTARPAPGMLDRHYAPAGELRLYTDPAAAAAAAIRARTGGRRVGAVVMGELGAPLDEVVALPAEARGYARLFYAALHALEAAECDLILVQAAPAGSEWDAVRDRQRRAGTALPA